MDYREMGLRIRQFTEGQDTDGTGLVLSKHEFVWTIEPVCLSQRVLFDQTFWELSRCWNLLDPRVSS